MAYKWQYFYIVNGHKMYLKEYIEKGCNHHISTEAGALRVSTKQANEKYDELLGEKYTRETIKKGE